MPISPFLEIAEDVLSDMPGKSGHINDITSRAMEANKNKGLDFDTLKKKINSALISSVKRKGATLFARVVSKGGTPGRGPFRKGMYRLKRSPSMESLPSPPPLKDSAFLGTGGEYAVASELMFWGFNVSFMAVDKGIDLIIEKENKYHKIQVKTASDSGGTWSFTIKNSSFAKNNSGETYYIFVLRQKSGNAYFVIPSPQIDIYLSTGIIKGAKSISIKITKSDSGKTWYLNSTEITHFMGSFHSIC